MLLLVVYAGWFARSLLPYGSVPYGICSNTRFSQTALSQSVKYPLQPHVQIGTSQTCRAVSKL